MEKPIQLRRVLEIYKFNLIIAAVAHCTKCEPPGNPYDSIGLKLMRPAPGQEHGDRLIPVDNEGPGDRFRPGDGNKPEGRPRAGGGTGNKEQLPAKLSDNKNVPLPRDGNDGDQPGPLEDLPEAITADVPASPVSGKEMTVTTSKRQVSYRRETFEVEQLQYYCSDSRQAFTNKALDAINQEAAAEAYRKQYGLPTAEEIRQIRDNYGLDTGTMATLLGVGRSTYHNYEAGSIPQRSTARLIQLAAKRENIEALAELAGVDLPGHVDAGAE